MATTELTKKEWRKMLAQANRAGARAARIEPRAVNTLYVAREAAIRVELKNGVVISIPVQFIPELKGATAHQMREVEVLGAGGTLHWESLDLDYGVPNLISSLFNPEWMVEIGTLDCARTAARKAKLKSKAARKNGRKLASVQTHVSHAGAARR